MVNKLFSFPLVFIPPEGDHIDPRPDDIEKVPHPDSSPAGSRRPVWGDKQVVVVV